LQSLISLVVGIRKKETYVEGGEPNCYETEGKQKRENVARIKSKCEQCFDRNGRSSDGIV